MHATVILRSGTTAMCWLVVACSSTGPAAPSAQQLQNSAALVRSTLCNGMATGSGFFISEQELVTNRHVVADARELSIETADNHTVAVDDVLVSYSIDAAVLHVRAADVAPLTLGADPAPGDDAWVVGFPRGGKVRVTNGRVVDEVQGRKYEVTGRVIRARAEVDPGDSGGPLLNQRGQVAGLVFAVEYSSGWTLAIPVSELAQALPTMHSAPAARC
jgi:S1-C subfamily serine protease